jgi:hypothetical protein
MRHDSALGGCDCGWPHLTEFQLDASLMAAITDVVPWQCAIEPPGTPKVPAESVGQTRRTPLTRRSQRHLTLRFKVSHRDRRQCRYAISSLILSGDLAESCSYVAGI